MYDTIVVRLPLILVLAEMIFLQRNNSFRFLEGSALYDENQ